MPVSTASPVISYTASGSATVFPFPFKVLEQSHVIVTLDGDEVSGYTAIGVGNDNGGYVSFSVAPVGLLVIRRIVPLGRSEDYQASGALREDTLDGDLDRRVMQIQQIGEEAARSLRIAPGFSTALEIIPEGDSVVGFNSAKELIVIPAIAGQSLVDVLAGLAGTGNSYNVGHTTQTVGDKLGERVSIKDHGAVGDGVANDLPAYQAARTAVGANGTVYLPGPATYYFAGVRPDLSGCNIYADQGVVVKTDENPNSKTMKLVTPLTVQNTVTTLTITKPANIVPDTELLNLPTALDQVYLDEVTSIVDMTTWQHRAWTTPTGSVATSGTGTLTSSQLTWAADFTANPQVLINSSLTTGSLYELNFANVGGTVERVGFIARSATDSRIHVVRVQVGIGTLVYTVFDFAGAVISTVTYALPNAGAYGAVANQEFNIGFVPVSATEVSVLVGGIPMLKITTNWSELGFVVLTDGDATKITVKDMLATTNYQIRSKKPLNIGVIGDSISYGAWASLAIENTLPIALQNYPWAGDVVVTNYAVSGTATAYWVTQTASMDFSAHDVVVCMLGTNDQQSGVSVATYTANLSTIKTQVTADGPEMVFAIPPVFTATTVTGTGVTTSQYSNHAIYTHALKKWCVSNGVQFGDVRRNFGANLNWYMDNIHPTVEGHIAYLAAIVEGLGKLLKNRNAYFGW